MNFFDQSIDIQAEVHSIGWRENLHAILGGARRLKSAVEVPSGGWSCAWLIAPLAKPNAAVMASALTARRILDGGYMKARIAWIKILLS